MACLMGSSTLWARPWPLRPSRTIPPGSVTRWGGFCQSNGKERHVATRLCLMGRNAVDPRTSYQKTSLLQYSLLGGGGPRTERLVETAERLGFGRVKPLRSDGQFKQLGACQGVKCHPNSWGEREDHLSNCLAGLDFGPSMCIDVQKSHVKEAIFPLTNHTEVILSCGLLQCAQLVSLQQHQPVQSPN